MTFSLNHKYVFFHELRVCVCVEELHTATGEEMVKYSARFCYAPVDTFYRKNSVAISQSGSKQSQSLKMGIVQPVIKQYSWSNDC